jgi:hypothetical protein
VIADWWVTDGSQSTNAFTAASFFSSYAAAMGYFIFPFCEREGMVTTVFITGLLGAIFYFCAFRAHSAQVAELPTEEKRALAHRQFWDRRSRITRITRHNDEDGNGSSSTSAVGAL